MSLHTDVLTRPDEVALLKQDLRRVVVNDAKPRTRWIMRLTVAAIAAAVGGSVLVAVPAPTDDSAVLAALQAAEGVASSDPQVALAPDRLSVETDLVQIGLDPSNGVTIGPDDARGFTVSLPGGDFASEGLLAENGTVTYPAVDGVSNAVVPTTSGVQLLTIIDNEQASSAFDYEVEMPAGGRIALMTEGPADASDGTQGAIVFDGAGTPVAVVEPPWASDASGARVPTFFSTDGKSLTQHVEHRADDIAYPVVADPNFRWYASGVVITLTYDDTVAVAGGGIYALSALLATTGVGLVPGVILTKIALDASWGVATRTCAWIWAPYPWRSFEMASSGYYNC